MAQTAMAVRGLGHRYTVIPSRRQPVSRPVYHRCASALVISASKDGCDLPSTLSSSTHLRQIAGSWVKTGLMAGACFFLGFGSGAAHAKRALPPPELATLAFVEQPAPATPSTGGSGGAQAAMNWQQLVKDLQASPYALPVLSVVLLVTGISLLTGGSRKDAAPGTSTSGATATVPAAAPLPPAAVPAPAPLSPPPAAKPIAQAAPPAPVPGASVVVKPRPMTVSANPNMAAPQSRPPAPALTPAAPAPTPAAAVSKPVTIAAAPFAAAGPPAAPARPAPPPTLAPAPAAAPVPPPAQTPIPAPAPVPAPTGALVETRPSAKEWISNWRASQPPKPAKAAKEAPAPAPAPVPAPDLEPAAAPAPVSDFPAYVDSRPSAKEWIAMWRATQSPAKPEEAVEEVVAAVAGPVAAAPPEPVPAPAPEASAPALVVGSRPSAKEWIANWRASQPPKEAPAAAAEPSEPPAATATVPSAPAAAEALASEALVPAPSVVALAVPRLSAAELLKLAGAQPDVVSSAAKSTAVVAKEGYVVFKFGEEGAAVAAQPISVLQPPGVRPSNAAVAAGSPSAFDSTVSTDDLEDDIDVPSPPMKAAAVTVAAARVVQGPPPPVAPSTPATSTPQSPAVNNGSNHIAPVVAATPIAAATPTASVAPTAVKASDGTRDSASSGSSSGSRSGGVSEASLAAAARDPIVMTAAVVVGAARQMKGFGTFVSDGLVPAVGALLGAGSSKPNRR